MTVLSRLTWRFHATASRLRWARLEIRRAEALTGKGTDLDFGLVEPASVLERVMQLNLDELRRRQLMDRCWTRAIEPLSEPQEDRQPLIDRGNFFRRKLTEHAPDPPLIH